MISLQILMEYSLGYKPKLVKLMTKMTQFLFLVEAQELVLLDVIIGSTQIKKLTTLVHIITDNVT